MKRRKIGLPRFTVKQVYPSLSEIVDWGLVQNNIPKTWSITEGEGIIVFILDTSGVTTHPDLVENFTGGVNVSGSKTSEDIAGHGGACAGIIAAARNDSGVVGVAPKAKFFMVKVLGDEGYGSASAISRGLQFCYESLSKDIKPNIVSMSLGGAGPIGNSGHWIKKLYEANVPVICAAGNSGKEGVNYPAKYPECIAVGAYDKDGNLANFSTTGDEIAFAAPGVNVCTTWKNGDYAVLNGTSFSCPFVAGIVALLLAKHKKQENETGLNDCRTVEEIKAHLIKHSIDKGALGKDKGWGWGIVNVEELIKD